MFIETELARCGADSVTLYSDQFRVVGSRNVVVPGLSELTGLGFIEWTRFPKRHRVGLSNRWRDIATKKQAMIVSATARVQKMPLMPSPSQPASVSA